MVIPSHDLETWVCEFGVGSVSPVFLSLWLPSAKVSWLETWHVYLKRPTYWETILERSLVSNFRRQHWKCLWERRSVSGDLELIPTSLIWRTWLVMRTYLSLIGRQERRYPHHPAALELHLLESANQCSKDTWISKWFLWRFAWFSWYFLLPWYLAKYCSPWPCLWNVFH